MTTLLFASSPGIDIKQLNDQYIWISIDTELIGPNDKPTPHARWCCGGISKQHFLVPVYDFVYSD